MNHYRKIMTAMEPKDSKLLKIADLALQELCQIGSCYEAQQLRDAIEIAAIHMNMHPLSDESYEDVRVIVELRHLMEGPL